MTSTASCTLDGHLVIIDSFTSSSRFADMPALTKGTETYYAQGSGWLAFLADRGQTADETTLQMQLTNDAGGLVSQALNSSAPPPSSLDAQKQIVQVIATALGGTVGHTPA